MLGKSEALLQQAKTGDFHQHMICGGTLHLAKRACEPEEVAYARIDNGLNFHPREIEPGAEMPTGAVNYSCANIIFDILKYFA